MPTHAEIAGKLLVDAAGFFKTLAQQNTEIQKEMSENAAVFEQVSSLLITQPTGMVNGKPHSELAGKLLQDAAEFFRTLAEQNPPLAEQMNENANVFDQVAELVMGEPLGVME